MQRHECRPLVSHSQTNSVIQKDLSQHLQSSAAHSNEHQIAAPECGHGKDPLWCNVTQNQDFMLPHASCAGISDQLHARKAWCFLQNHFEDKRKQHSVQSAEKKKSCHCRHKEILAVEMDPAPRCTTCILSQVQLLTAQPSTGFQARMRGRRWRGAEGSRWSTNPLLLLRLIIFLHSSTNLPFLPLFLSPQILPHIHSL